MARRYELSSEQWQRIESLLPGKACDSGRSGQDNRLFVNGVLWVSALRSALGRRSRALRQVEDAASALQALVQGRGMGTHIRRPDR